MQRPARIIRPHGALAQLVERLHRTQQVRGSNPLCSIGSEPFTIGHEGGRLLVFQGFADIGGKGGKRGSGTFACTIQPPCVALLHAPGVAPGESREPAWQAACQPSAESVVMHFPFPHALGHAPLARRSGRGGVRKVRARIFRTVI